MMGAIAVGGFVAAVGIVSKIADSFGTAITGARKFLGLLQTDQVKTAASATLNASKTALAWLGATARMAGQGIMSAASWAAGMAARAVSVAVSATVNAATTAAAWLASTASTAADALATGGAWLAGTLARFLMVSGAAVAQAAVTAGAWIAANSAMLLAGGGITAILAGVVIAVVELAKHWSQVWHDIKQWAWDAWHFIDEYVVQPIKTAFDWLWRNAIKPLWDGWNSFWGGLKDTAESIWHFIDDNIIQPMKDAFGWVSDTIGSIGNGISSAASSVGSFLGFDEGGPVPGAAGRPMLAVVHGGEYVLSRDMLAGKVTPKIPNLAGIASGGGSLALAPTGGGGGGGTAVYVVVQGNQILGDNGVNQLAKKVGAQIATRLLPGAGVKTRA
jgi:hypothetical protein